MDEEKAEPFWSEVVRLREELAIERARRSAADNELVSLRAKVLAMRRVLEPETQPFTRDHWDTSSPENTADVMVLGDG